MHVINKYIFLSDNWLLILPMLEKVSLTEPRILSFPGKPPWSGSGCGSQASTMYHIASSDKPPQLPACLSDEAQDFLLHCFNRKPERRPDAMCLMAHPWLASVVVPCAKLQQKPSLTAGASSSQGTPCSPFSERNSRWFWMRGAMPARQVKNEKKGLHI